MFASLFEVLSIGIQEEIHHFAGWEGGLTGTKILNKHFVKKLAFPNSLRLLNALNSEDRGLKVRFSLAMIAFETFELILCQMLSSQGRNAPSNPCPHYKCALLHPDLPFLALLGFPCFALFEDVLACLSMLPFCPTSVKA